MDNPKVDPPEHLEQTTLLLSDGHQRYGHQNTDGAAQSKERQETEFCDSSKLCVML